MGRRETFLALRATLALVATIAVVPSLRLAFSFSSTLSLSLIANSTTRRLLVWAGSPCRMA